MIMNIKYVNIFIGYIIFYESYDDVTSYVVTSLIF